GIWRSARHDASITSSGLLRQPAAAREPASNRPRGVRGCVAATNSVPVTRFFRSLLADQAVVEIFAGPTMRATQSIRVVLSKGLARTAMPGRSADGKDVSP